jgi:hypothetical protein
VRCVLASIKIFFGISDGIGNMLKHLLLPKEQVFNIGREISNLLEMLLYGHFPLLASNYAPFQ